MVYKITTHDSARRPWGIETLVTVDDSGTIYNFAICTKEKPTNDYLETEAVALVEVRKQRELELSLVEVVISLEDQKRTLEDEIVSLEAQKASLEDDIAELERR